MSKLLAHSTEGNERSEDVIIQGTTTFESMLLQDTVLRGLAKNGFCKPSPIQVKAVPMGRCGFDLIVKSKSGTGKTLVFTIIALENVDVSKESVQILVIAPTREIAVQIHYVMEQIGSFIKGLKVHSFIGGLPLTEDIEKCKSCHIAVGTPGRLKHLINEKILSINSVRLFVLDEVDKLTETAFLNDINEIYNNLSTRKQIITTSATYPEELQDFVGQYMLSPTFVSSEVGTPFLLGLKQFVKIVPSQSNVIQQMRIKNDILNTILTVVSFTQCLVFSNYQSRAESISNFLNQKNWSSAFISAAQTQKERLAALNSLKEFKCRIMLSTDLTARGIDAANVDLVINYDIPADAMTYLHRMGRSGRYGSTGVCINLAFEGQELLHLQKILGCIGGSELSVPELPEFAGSLKDLANVEVPQDQLVQAVVTDGIKDIVRERILELKAEKFKENKVKTTKKKSKLTTKETSNNDIMNILDNKGEVDKVMEQIQDMDANKILESLVCGTFEFGNSSSEAQVQCGSNADKMDAVRDLLSSTKTNIPKDHAKPDEQTANKTTDRTQELFCKNKALLAVSKVLNSSKDVAEESSIEEYLNLIKQQEREALSQISKDDVTHSLEDSVQFEHILRKATEQQPIPEDVNERNEGLAHDKNYEHEDIFQLGYESIVKSDGEAWKKWKSSNESSKPPPYDIEEEYYEEEDPEDCKTDENAVEIMKWVPVSQSRQKTVETAVENPMDCVSLPTFKGVPLQPTCIAEASSVDSYEQFYGYFDNCSYNLWQTGLSFENVESFDDWFAYEWEAQLHSIRNYVQQNIYVEEMSRFQTDTVPGRGTRPA